MIPTIEDLQGTWVSRNFPMYHYDDNFEFTFYFGRLGTLYMSQGGNRTFADGIYEINNMGEENFNIVIDGRFMELLQTTLNGRLYIRQNPLCFAMLIPEYGWRYFEKL